MNADGLEKLRRDIALKLARKALEHADFSRGIDLLTDDERAVYEWLEDLYYADEVTYRQLWAAIPRTPRCQTD